ncbi:MAG: CAP domain-containing protein [Candidatus Peregrinibacteria bacterium]|nr:CAP domain-containing protein [Candidatus Peregrinibacteria bacterium]MDZ4244917.1 CAP domain-containing protein [Candidatus Gracilibacteria bacterium]
MRKNISTSLFERASGLVTIGLVLSALFGVAQAFALISNEFYLDENNEIQYYNCARVLESGVYRTCATPAVKEDFDVVPSVGSFVKKEGILNISDLNYDDEYRFAMEYMVREGYFTLFRGNAILQDRKLTREKFIDILVDVLEISVPSNTRTDCFADLRLMDRRKSKAIQTMRKKKICYAQAKGWLDNNLKFMPVKNISKASAAKILMSAYNFPGGFTNLNDAYFEDVSSGTWFARFVNAGRKNNIFPDKRRFDPGALLTRRDASIWFYNLKRAVRSPMPEDVQITDIKQFTESKLAQLINESRQEYGKQQLKFDEQLYTLAVTHSQSMKKDNSLTHGDLRNYKQFLGRDYQAIGENISVFKTSGSSNISKMVERIHTNMMMEPHGELNHRANILGESFAFTYYAIAAYEDKKDGRIWITEIFAKKQPGR